MPASRFQLHLGVERLTLTALNNDDGEVVSVVRPIQIQSPQEEGWLEQRPEEWWLASRDALVEIRHHAAVATVPETVIECDFAATVFLDAEREAIRPAILEGDVRNPHPILWLRKHQPIAFKRVCHLLQPAAYLRMKLIGYTFTTPSEAARTGLFDAETGAWNEGLCRELEINRELLPPIRS